jgi:hypothetical protein
MATSKQPPFPNPPLEWGIPQYPTPNVPDFYTKDGHIILVEKVSAEKGSYNPQPLDGSVTYSKRDANKWPTDLYLVYQKPDETGAFVYNYYANDRTLASQDAWNFGLDYSANNPDFPVTSRTYIVPRSQYETVELGATDPVFGGNQIIAAQKKVELPDDSPLRSRYVGVQRVYETIPGPILAGERVNERGDVETITQQTVVAGTAPDADGLLVTQTAVQPVDSVKSTKTTGTVESYSTLTSKANRGGLLGSVSISDNIVSPSTNPDALSQTVLDSTVEAVSTTKSRKRTTTSTGPTSLAGNSQKSGLLGNVSTTESIVAYGSNADDLSTTVLQSDVIPIDSAKSKKTTITSTGPTSLEGQSIGEFGYVTSNQSIVGYASAIPAPSQNTVELKKEPIDLAKAKLINSSYDSTEVLNGYQYDADLNLIVSNTKEIISEGASPLAIQDGLLAYSDTPVNAWQSIRIQSRINSLPANRTEYKTGAYASPNLLYGFNSSVFNFPDGQIQYNVTPVMRAKRSYQTVFKHETSFQYGQPSAPSDTLFDPISIHVIYDGFFFKIDIPDCLTKPGMFLRFFTGINTPASAYYGVIDETYTIPVSTTTSDQYLNVVGTYKLIAYEIDYWKANIWRIVKQSVLIK